jgi:tRNA G10  N-methylase Trm11
VDNSANSGSRLSASEPPAVSVWTTAQSSPAAQRKNKYTPESTAHPAKMLPEVVRHAVAHYTRPGELVLDPICGIGTTLVEAVRLGRRAVGVEYEPTGCRSRTRTSTSHASTGSNLTHECSTAMPASSSRCCRPNTSARRRWW